MASHVTNTNNIGSLELEQVLVMKREPAPLYIYNSLDKHVVSVVKHIPCNVAPVISPFLARDCNMDSVKIMGKRVNCGCKGEGSTSSI